jgi:hypothetical protein
VVDGTGEHAGQLGAADARLEAGQLGLGLADRGLVVLGRAELQKDGVVLYIAGQLLDRLELLLKARALAVNPLRPLGILPEVGGERLALELLDSRFQLRDVKGAPLAP